MGESSNPGGWSVSNLLSFNSIRGVQTLLDESINLFIKYIIEAFPNKRIQFSIYQSNNFSNSNCGN